MDFKVKVFTTKAGKKTACIIGVTAYTTYHLTFDPVAVCLALGLTREEIATLNEGIYDIKERR